MSYSNVTGFLASVLVLATFGMGDMVRLRLVAICSNFAFIAYGLTLGLTPVWLLHSVLLPLNVWRLRQVIRSMSTAPCPCPTMLMYFAQGPRQPSLVSERREQPSIASQTGSP
jgi:CRP/FNR family transcriptional regulator, cyclic AMP receptor protein